MNFARAASTVRTVAKSALDLLNPLSYRKRPQHSRLLLKDFSGSITAGEMLLVIGKPGSGCTTFLKALSNMRGEYKGTLPIPCHGCLHWLREQRYDFDFTSRLAFFFEPRYGNF